MDSQEALKQKEFIRNPAPPPPKKAVKIKVSLFSYF